MTMHHNNYIRQKIGKTLTYVPIIIITRKFSQNNEQGLPQADKLIFDPTHSSEHVPSHARVCTHASLQTVDETQVDQDSGTGHI